MDSLLQADANSALVLKGLVVLKVAIPSKLLYYLRHYQWYFNCYNIF